MHDIYRWGRMVLSLLLHEYKLSSVQLCLSFHLSVYPSACLSVCLHALSACLHALSACPTCLSACMTSCLWQSVCHPASCLFGSVCFCLLHCLPAACLSACLSFSLSVSLPFSLSVSGLCPFVYLSVYFVEYLKGTNGNWQTFVWLPQSAVGNRN